MTAGNEDETLECVLDDNYSLGDSAIEFNDEPGDELQGVCVFGLYWKTFTEITKIIIIMNTPTTLQIPPPFHSQIHQTTIPFSAF